MRRIWLCLSVIILSLDARDKVVVFPCNLTGTELFISGKHPDPGVYVWSMIKEKLNTLGLDLIITQTQKCNSNFFNDPSIKYFCFHNFFNSRSAALKHIPFEKRLFWIWEPMTVHPEFYAKSLLSKFSKIFTFDDSLLDGKKYYKFYYPYNLSMIQSVVPFENKNFCCLINSKRAAKKGIKWKDFYAERSRVIHFFERNYPKELHLYGKGWAGCRCSKGYVKNKIETIKRYRFCLCYENTNTPGYVTEKIFDCFRAGVVPVYLGAENVTDTIPENCFVDRRKFETHEELYQFLKEMDEDTYNKYIDCIRDYLSSEMGYVYTPNSFIESFVGAVTSHEAL